MTMTPLRVLDIVEANRAANAIIAQQADEMAVLQRCLDRARASLQSIRVLKPINMACDYWSHEEGLRPDDVFDLCDQGLA